MNYYNEFDPFAAKWLRELIKTGHISQGEVDERSIEDVLPRRLDDGSTNVVGRLRGYGNALCAPVAQAFIEAYLESE